MDQAIQVVGALMILAGFAGSAARPPSSRLAQVSVLNLVGSAVLAWLAVVEEQWGFLLLEAVWAAVSAWSLIRVARGLPVAGAH